MMTADPDPIHAEATSSASSTCIDQRQRTYMRTNIAVRHVATVTIAGVALLLASILVVVVSNGNAGSSINRIGAPSTFYVTDQQQLHLQRKASTALPGGGCTITPAVVPAEPIDQVFVASYPGSGAKMTWHLVQALTGFITGDEHQLNGLSLDYVASIKSHWPHPQGNPMVDGMTRTDNKRVPRAVILIRHPMDSIPSFYNYIYERTNGLGGHTTRAPLVDWLMWRNEHFDEEIENWARHADYWLSRYNKDERMIISYEGLTDWEGGIPTSRALAAFLDKSRGVQTIDDISIPCVWAKIIKYKEVEFQNFPDDDEVDDEEDDTSTVELAERSLLNGIESLRNGERFYPYTKAQYEKMITFISALRTKYILDPKLVAHLDAYQRICENHITNYKAQ